MKATAEEPAPGVIVVDKPEGWTSHDVVAHARRVLCTKRIGHAGTLDPMATGVLVLGVGKATRLLSHMVGLDKVYTATMRLGQSTLSDDRCSDVRAIADARQVERLMGESDRLHAEARQLTGDILQVPCAVSAIHVDGKRAYDLTRRGQEVELPARPVTVYAFELGTPELVMTESGLACDVTARVHCSSGTYVRALARDLGLALGIGGHLTALRRERVGNFTLADAVTGAQLTAAAPPRRGPDADAESETDRERRLRARAELNLIDPAAAAARVLPVLEVDLAGAVALRYGQTLRPPADAPEVPLAAAVYDGRLVAIVRRHDDALKVATGFPSEVSGFPETAPRDPEAKSPDADSAEANSPDADGTEGSGAP